MVGYPKGIKVKMDVKGLSLTKVRSSTEEDGKAGRFDEAKRASAMMSWPFEQRTSARNDLASALSFAQLDCMLAHVGHFRILVLTNQCAILVSRDVNSNVGGNNFLTTYMIDHKGV